MNAAREQISERTCVGCRKVAPRDALLRWFPDGDGMPIPDWTGRGDRLSSRAAWTHFDRGCIRKALERGGFARAWRGSVARADADALVADAISLGERVWLKRIGLANRAGSASVGQQAVRERLQREAGGLLLVTADSGESGKEKFSRNAARKDVPVVMVRSGEELGAALGRSFVSVVHVSEGAFSERLLVWSKGLAGLGSGLAVVSESVPPSGGDEGREVVGPSAEGTQPRADGSLGTKASQERACRSV